MHSPIIINPRSHTLTIAIGTHSVHAALESLMQQVFLNPRSHTHCDSPLNDDYPPQSSYNLPLTFFEFH